MNTKPELPETRIVTVDSEGKPVDAGVLDETNIAYDPTQMTVDLTKAEKRRTTALMLAINAYEKLIIKDAEMFRAIATEAARNNGPVIQPATMSAMVQAAIDFDRFISGEFSQPQAHQAEEHSDGNN